MNVYRIVLQNTIAPISSVIVFISATSTSNAITTALNGHNGYDISSAVLLGPLVVGQ